MSEQRSDHAPGSSPAWEEPPGLIHALVTGCCIAAPIVFVVSAAGVHACGQSWTRSVLFSLFIVFWGGIGFGCMFGAVVWATRLEQATAPVPAHERKAGSFPELAAPTPVGSMGEPVKLAEAELVGRTG